MDELDSSVLLGSQDSSTAKQYITCCVLFASHFTCTVGLCRLVILPLELCDDPIFRYVTHI